MSTARRFIHETRCRRKDCRKWNQIVLEFAENLVLDIGAAWEKHRVSCANCKKCQVCFLEGRCNQLIMNDTFMMKCLKEKDVGELGNLMTDLIAETSQEARLGNACSIL